jgi:DNA-binding NarL/FixJ family response regulator
MHIFLADDHHIVAKGIATLLEGIEEVESVSIFQNGKELIQELNKEKPDLIFLDLLMPVMDGRETLKMCTKLIPTIPCCMLSMINEKPTIMDCIDLGAKGFIHKNCTVEELKEAMHEILAGEIFYSKETLKYLSGIKKNNGFSVAKANLTERELEILEFICEGLTSKEIGDKLNLSSRTIESHKKNMMQKFNVNNVTKLVSIVLKNKILDQSSNSYLH